MSKKRTLEEVKKHFENAKIVRCLSDGLLHDLTEKEVVCHYPRADKSSYATVFSHGKYAEIVEYINPIKEMTFTLEQLKEHGELILELAKDPTILIEKKQSTGWLLATCPRFDVNTEYRKRPVPIFTNELGEEFTQQDLDDNIAVFSYFFKARKVRPFDFDLPNLGSCSINSESTSISKTEVGALKLAIKYLEDGEADS